MQRGGLFRNQDRISLRKNQDSSRQLNGFGAGSEKTQRCKGFEYVAEWLRAVRRYQDVVAGPQG